MYRLSSRVRLHGDDAAAHGWHIVSDTSWAGYREMPLDIMAGYSVMGHEAIAQMQGTGPSHCFLPIGVGGLAAGIVALCPYPAS